MPDLVHWVVLSTRAAGDRVEVRVADQGPGIAAADLAQIFDPYFTTKRGGTGLGLPIAKNIVEGLGGTIGVTSVPGSGTELIIDFPAGGPEARASQALTSWASSWGAPCTAGGVDGGDGICVRSTGGDSGDKGDCAVCAIATDKEPKPRIAAMKAAALRIFFPFSSSELPIRAISPYDAKMILMEP